MSSNKEIPRNSVYAVCLLELVTQQMYTYFLFIFNKDYHLLDSKKQPSIMNAGLDTLILFLVGSEIFMFPSTGSVFPTPCSFYFICRIMQFLFFFYESESHTAQKNFWVLINLFPLSPISKKSPFVISKANYTEIQRFPSLYNGLPINFLYPGFCKNPAQLV